jgi:two-component system CheB/CheR fusion protein
LEEEIMSEPIIVSEAPSCVVGIGASAGGLEAIGELLRKLPDSTGMAFVIIQHLSPDYKSMLSEILCKYTMMPVIQAQNGLRMERNTVYLIPPKFNMEVRDGKLVLHEYVQTHIINHPIDIFLRSLAREYESHAIAVILSGTGSDGTNGIRAVKEQGGVILVQRPETAKFDGMPRSALQTGFADLSIGPEAIAEELTRISASMSSGAMGMTNEELLNKIYSILKKVSNINYTYYKQTTITRRIERRMVVNHVESLYEYVNLLRTNNDEATTLAKDVLIGVTSFFRDPECFEVLKERVVLPLLSNCEESRTIRVWVTGCSTGEEAYSVAILFMEAMEETGQRRRVKIFATDLDKDAILTAGKGQYGESILEDVSAQRLGRFFTKKGSSYLVSRELRKMIVFAPQNVFQDPPFGKLDLICCRNMMIYFQNVLQKDLFAIFHMALNDGGYLFLGKSESVNGCGEIFNALCPNEKIFLHNAAGRAPEDIKVRYHIPLMEDDVELPPQHVGGSEGERGTEELQLSLLEEFMQPCLLVDEQNCIRHIFGDCNNFLRLPTGKTENELFSMLTEDLRIPVSTALKAVRENGKRIAYDNISVRGERTDTVVAVAVVPVSNKFGENAGFSAVVFAELGSSPVPKGAVTYEIDSAAAQRISDLEKDLAKAQSDLKSTVSELETVNEELQATNEELLTANEELQSSNEELQSVNEELYTVNAEYQEKLNEVTSLNNDISNFLSSTLVGVIFLDDKLQIRRFTNYISQEFNIMEQDVGRSLQFITYNFINVNLIEVCQQVAAQLTAVETDVVSAVGKSYFMRVAPYRTEDQKILGLVLTFVDTTLQSSGSRELGNMELALKKAQDANREKDNFLSRMSHDMRTPLNGIIGIAQLMLAKGGLTPECESQIRGIQEDGVYLLGIISDILESSRISMGKLEIRTGPANEKRFLERILPMMQGSADHKGILLTSSVKGAKSRCILMDENHIMQVLVNLVSNAIKFTPEGGKVEFNATVRDLPDNRVAHEYVIADTGCGMNEEFQKRMYLPFEQDSFTRGREGSGTGLGLYIAKKFIDAMGGTIECRSIVNGGTTFTVRVEYSLADDIPPEAQTSERKQREVLAGKRILICEDQKINAEIASQMLRRIDMRCEVVSDGRQAVERFEASETGYFDAILMDIRMPVMNGYEATVAIRAQKRPDAASIPIIALTADAFSDGRVDCMNAGMNDCVYKPVDMANLYSTLFRYLSKTK